MARIRTIKPSFFTSLTIADLTLRQRLLFIGLWTHVDDEGRCVYDPRLLKAALFPLDDIPLSEIEADVQALSEVSRRTHGGLTEASILTVYRVQERSYISLGTFREHQKISHPTKSILPAPEEGETRTLTSTLEDSGNAHGGLTEDSVRAPGRKGKEGKGREVPSRPDVEALCNQLADLIEANGSPRPAITVEWLTQARLLIDKDGRDPQQVAALIAWCQASSFWRGNILSMPKFREKYDTMRLQKDGDRPGTTSRYFGKPGERRSMV